MPLYIFLENISQGFSIMMHFAVVFAYFNELLSLFTTLQKIRKFLSLYSK